MKNVFAVILALSTCTPAMAAMRKVVQFSDYPYLGSLGESAQSIEQEMLSRVKEACGGKGKLLRIGAVRIETNSQAVTRIKESGTPGDPSMRDAVFVFAYPRTTGEAEVYCSE